MPRGGSKPGRPGKPCPLGCCCGKHGAGVRLTPEDQRVRKNQLASAARQRQRAADPEAYRARSRERSREARAADPEKAAEYARLSRSKHRLERNARKREKHALVYDPDAQWVGRLWSAHRMRPEEWEAWYAAERGRCYIGGEPLPDDRSKIAIDHNHSCCPPNKSCASCRRGLACTDHNAGAGQFGDDPALLRRAAHAIETRNARVIPLIAAKPQQVELELGLPNPIDIKRAARQQASGDPARMGSMASSNALAGK